MTDDFLKKYAAWPHAAEYREGWEARREGVTVECNPYSHSETKQAAWKTGWLDAFDWEITKNLYTF